MSSFRLFFLTFLMVLLPVELLGETIILKGKVNVNIPFTMRLHNNGNTIEGIIQYGNQSTDAVSSVRGTIDDEAELTLYEYDDKNRIGTYNGTLQSGVYMGLYTKTNGETCPFTSSIIDDETSFNESIDSQFETATYSFKKDQNNIHVKIEVDYPINGNVELVNAARLFILSELHEEESDLGDLYNGEALVNHAGTIRYREWEDMKLNEISHPADNCYEMIDVNKSFENNKCVSFCVRSSFSLGGPFYYFCSGVTFRKDNGKQISVVRYPVDSNLKLKVEEAVKTELRKRDFMVDEEEFEVPMPERFPHLTLFGVQFDYQSEEIGGSALGQVSVIIPYEEILQFMTDEARQLIE